jgi:hypothetical protein
MKSTNLLKQKQTFIPSWLETITSIAMFVKWSTWLVNKVFRKSDVPNVRVLGIPKNQMILEEASLSYEDFDKNRRSQNRALRGMKSGITGYFQKEKE